MSRQDTIILALKSDIYSLLNNKFLNDYEYGMIRGISRTLFHLNLISEEEYKALYRYAFSKWEVNNID